MNTAEQPPQQHEPSHASHSTSNSGSGGKKRKPTKKIPKQHRVGNFRRSALASAIRAGLWCSFPIRSTSMIAD